MGASRAGNDIVPHGGPAPERLVQFGRVDAVLSAPPATMIVLPSMALVGSQAIGEPAERQNGDETSEHSATVRC
jgi:hypothetical protein